MEQFQNAHVLVFNGYLCQGGYAFSAVCLFVCLFVSRITKTTRSIFTKFGGRKIDFDANLDDGI